VAGIFELERHFFSFLNLKFFDSLSYGFIFCNVIFFSVFFENFLMLFV